MSDTATFSRGGDFATSRRGGLDAYEVQQVRDMHARGIGTQNIAKMLGRPVSSVVHIVRPPPPAPRVRLAVRKPGDDITDADHRNLDAVVTEAFERFGVSRADIMGSHEKKRYAAVRFWTWRRARAVTGLTHLQLGCYFGRHQSAMSKALAADSE